MPLLSPRNSYFENLDIAKKLWKANFDAETRKGMTKQQKNEVRAFMEPVWMIVAFGIMTIFVVLGPMQMIKKHIVAEEQRVTALIESKGGEVVEIDNPGRFDKGSVVVKFDGETLNCEWPRTELLCSVPVP